MINIKINPWVIFGFAAQFIFFTRFVVQWYASEKKKRTVVPKVFWHLSLVGTLMILVYSIYRQDIVFIVASSLNFLLYLRNLQIYNKSKNEDVKPD